jgi:hypothetical protein
VAAFLGALVALIAPVRLLQQKELLLAAAFLLSLYKLTTSCPTCPVVMVGPMSLSLLATVAYGTLLTLRGSERTLNLADQILPASIAASAIVQVFLFWDGEANCLPCAVTLGLNTALTVSWLTQSSPISLLTRSSYLSRSIAIGTAFAGAILILTLSTALNPTSQARIQQGLAARLSSARSLKGLNIAKRLGLSSKELPCLLVLTREGCHACDVLRRDMSGAEVPIVYVDCLLPGESSDGVRKTVDVSKFPVSSTPLVLGLNKDGLVNFELSGWSSDPGWAEQLVRRFQDECARSARLEKMP